MNSVFSSVSQEKLFDAVLRNLEHLGYKNELLQRDYSFTDYFEPNLPERIVPAAAFGQTPQSYDSACFAVLLSNGVSGAPLVNQCRALGAPLALEVREDIIVHWRVGRDVTGSKELLRIQPDQIENIFKEQEEHWAGHDILRQKGISFKLGPRQLDFIDLGLIPALEHQISSKLDRVLKDIVHEALALLKNKNGADALRGLYRLIFRSLAGKVLHDRGIPKFRNFSFSTPHEEILDAVADYYGEEPSVPNDGDLLKLVGSNIWTQLDFRNLSVEILAFIYENTFVNEEARRALGTHSTPHSIARYIVHQIPFDRLEMERRQTFEPFCGHGVFLVAALQRLRELLPVSMDGKERHRYFVRMLKGFEIDQFALEVCRLCLMLADFPNHNGWKLNGDDIFSSNNFAISVRQSHVILSNPPFEDFTAAEKKLYKHLSSVHKPAEFLNHVLSKLPSDGMLGVVLPKQFIDGRGYKEVREKIFQRFDSVEVLSLPDRIFENSEIESSLLIAADPRREDTKTFFVRFSEVSDKDRDRFMTQYVITRQDAAPKSINEAARTFHVVRFREVWDRLNGAPSIGEYAEIHRGIEWQAPFNEQLYISETQKRGFQRGLHRAENLFAFELPDSVYLNTQQEHQRGGAFKYRWEETKVVMNAVRISRGPWKIAAFVDSTGLICSQNFHALWPVEPWTPKTLAAVLNSPIANAFVDSHEIAKHIRKQTVASIPLPVLDREQISYLESLVDQYTSTPVKSRNSSRLIADNEKQRRERSALIAIDAFLLKAYGLPPRMEREVLDYFLGVQRPVPMDFSEYFPDNFGPTLPLWMYISPEYRRCTAQNLLEKLPRITDAALIEALEEASE